MGEPEALPLEFIYSPHTGGGRISLYEGPADLDDLKVQLRAFVDLTGAGEWVCELDYDGMVALGDSTLRFVDDRCGQAVVRALVLSTGGKGLILHADLGDGAPIESALLHWLNLPWFSPAEALSTESGYWMGRTTIDAGDWRLTLDVRRDHSQAMSALPRSASLMSHVGLLSRADGEQFSVEEAEDTAFGLQIAFSFALGGWVSPGPLVLFRKQSVVGALWRPWRNDPEGSVARWLNIHRSQDMGELCRLFMREWTSGALRRALVRHFATHVIEAGRHGSLEARVLVLASAVQYLHWITYVVDAGLTSYPSGEPRLAVKLRELLAAASIDCKVPSDLDALVQLVGTAGVTDGPDAVSWVRNRFAHPKDAEEPYRIERLVQQAWSLLLEYTQLLLLHRLGYSGEFVRQFPPWRSATASEPVPWAVESGHTSTSEPEHPDETPEAV